MDSLWCQKRQLSTVDFTLKRQGFVKVQSSGMKNLRKGFIIILLLPLIMTLMAGLSGLTFMSLGIKNLTHSQSLCITENVHGQRKLGELLTHLLKLNQTVTRLEHTKQALQTALIGAISLGQIQAVPTLKKQISLVKKYQKYITQQQKHILMKSEFIRKITVKKVITKLKTLETRNIQEKKVFKKALAVSKKTLGSNAYTYKPVPNFKNQQTVTFSWEINPFLKERLYELFPFQLQQKLYIKKQCATTLKKQQGQWTAQLTH